ncbi:5' nucleotidase, NT5C type [Psychrobacillus lasiicapitis]|uniref:Nucleotidase n=1 Tax=Psychrobacillus lasiicapitis TaxID=1636719 RepID=A0A544T8R0_9BACI|nr:HAD family acid phosphatase [Psychrobacillus lasiicapitis]TQR13826.1 hypothetical protein FG382_09435 [Psychrobacillus lasiicapitis]GGA35735.1 putative nucleotidase [Psychrobacillus lasiicapitis]
MRFGFDIDDTLINLREHAFHVYNKKLNQNIALEIFHALNKVEIHEPFGMTAEEGSKMWNSSLEEIYYTNCPPYLGAVELLQQLTKEGHEIFYITARPPEHRERTKKWLEEQGFPVKNENFYCGMKDQEKVNIIKKLQLDYYFDDKPDVLNTLANCETKVFVKTQSYNEHLTIPRFSDWSEWKQLIGEAENLR